jgi:mRNA interferase MazF
MLPDAGDIAWVNFDPTLGSEQAGRRPALVLTGRIYHEQSWRAVVCPITSKDRSWPFNVALPKGLKTTGVVLVDQVRAIDRSRRMFDVVERVPEAFVDEVRGRLIALLGIDPISVVPGPGTG